MSRSSSAVVDSKVVEMSLENSNFEKNATTSLSTIQKLKEALSFKTSKDGFDNLNTSIKKVDFNPAIQGVGMLRNGLDGLADTIGFAAVMRYTNMALGAIENLTKSMTVDQVAAGWQKFGEKTTSVATLVAQGYALEEVNAQLDKLNWFTDETSYNFTEMVANIAKFTASGQGLEESVTAMEGIANWAALSGQNAATASRAMYQISQAMGAGVMRKEDYKSIQNASMDTDEFRQHCIDAAIALKTLKQNADGTYQSLVADSDEGLEAFTKSQFAERLTAGQWLTKDVMMKVFNEYSAAVGQIYEYTEEKGITASEAIQEAGGQFDEFGVKAFKAAQEARTWTDVVDSIKDAVSTTFMNMFEIIIGDYEQATSLWTSMANGLYDIIVEPINSVNEVLAESFGAQEKFVTSSDWDNLGLSETQASGLAKALKEVAEANGVAFEDGNIESFIETLDKGWLTTSMIKEALDGFGQVDTSESTKSLEELHEAAMKVIKGGSEGYSTNMEERFAQLTEDGFDPQQVQDYVNELHKLAGGTWNITDAIIAQADANLNLEESIAQRSDEELIAMGYTEKEIKQLRKLQKTAEKTGKPLNELLNAEPEESGRDKLLANLVVGLEAIGNISAQVSKAFSMIFPPLTAETITNLIDKIGIMTDAFQKFTRKHQHNIRNIFLGIFSAIDLVIRVVKNLATSAFGLLTRALQRLNIVKFAGRIGLVVKQVRDWIVENQIIEKTFDKLSAGVVAVATAIEGWIHTFLQIPQVENIVASFGDTFSYIYENMPGILTKAYGKLVSFKDAIVAVFSSAKTPQEFFEGIKEAFKQLWTDISSSEVMARLKESFGVLKENIKSYINELGNNDDGSRNVFGKIIDAAVKFKTSIGNILRGVDDEGNKIDIFAGIKAAFSQLWTDISTSGIGGKIKEALSTVWTAIDSFFSSLGKDELGNLNIFGQIWETVRNGLTWIYEKATTAKTAIHDFFVEYKLGEFFSSVFDSLLTGAKGFFSKFPGFVQGAKEKFGEFIEKVKSLGGFKFENIGKIWAAFKDTVAKYFKDADIFKPIITAFTEVKRKVIAKLKELGIDILGIKDKIVGFFTGIADGVKGFSLPEAFDGFVKFFLGSNLEDGVTTVGDVLFNFFEKVKSFVSGLDAGKITGIVVALLAFKGLTFLGNLVKPIEALIGAMAKEKKAKANFLNKAAMLEMAASIALLAVVVSILAKLKVTELAKGIVAIGAILLIFGIFAKSVSKFDAKGMIGAAVMISSIAGSLLLLIVSIKLLGNMIVDDLGRTLAGLAGLVVLMVALYALSKIMNKMGGKSNLFNGAGMLAMVGALFGMLVLIQLITFMPLTKILKGLGKLILIAAVLTVMMAAMKKAVGDGLSVSIGIAGLAACIIAISLALKVISTIEPDKLAYSVAALSLTMLALAGVLYAAKGLEKGLGAMIGLAAVILALTGALAILSLIKPTSLIAPVAALGILLGMLALLSGITGAMKPALSSMLMMVILVAAIGTVLFLLATLPDTDAVIKIATALGLIFAGLGIAMYGAVAAGSAAGVALVGLLVMVAFIAAFTALAWAIGKLGGEQKDTIQTGLDIIVAVLGGLGKAVGAFFAGIATELFDTLPQIGKDITGFMEALAPLNEIGMVDIGPLSEAILSILGISAVGFADSILSIATELTEGKTAAQTVADDMTAIATAFATYATTMSQFDGLEIDTQPLMDAVAVVLGASLVGFVDGLASIVTELTEGKSSVELVATDMAALATGFSTYATTMSQFDGIEIDTTALDDIIDIIGEISLQGLLTSLGSLLLGDEDKSQVTQFSEDMTTLASALVNWQSQMAPLEGLTVPTEDINKLKEALDSIKEGGILDSVLNFFGVDTKPDYTSFTEGIKGLGGAINDFANSLGEDFDATKMTTATDAIKKLSEVGVALGDVDFGGWFHDGVLVNFARELVKIVPDLNAFSTSFEDTEKFASIASATKDLATGAAALTHVTFGSGDLTDSELVTSVSDNVKTLKSMVESLAGIDTSGVTSFTSALSSINAADISSAAKQLDKAKSADANAGKDLTNSIVDGIDSKSIKSGISSALSDAMSGLDTSSYNGVGISLGTQIGLGILKSAATIKTSVSTVVKAGKNEADSYKTGFMAAGRNFDQGLIDGMNQHKARVISAAADVAARALDAAKRRLDIQSPSREMAKVGRFFDLGFANGIRNFAGSVYDESSTLATLAMEGVRKATNNVSDLLQGAGFEQPRVTPILDLSQIQNGASLIDGMLSTSPTIYGNFSAIATNADAIRAQNSNIDILNALEHLGNSLGSSRPGDTYNVNGVTYDDGSNMANAVRAMIREARIERRA